MLAAAGADVEARGEGQVAETPLQWAASSDDRDVAEALIAAGADIEADGASIAGGTALDNAVGYGCWRVARLLVDRGARVDKLWHAAALGLTKRLDELLAQHPPASAEQINEAFWQACHGGQRRAAEYLLGRRTDLRFVPSDGKVGALEVAASQDTQRSLLVDWLRERTGKDHC